MGALLMGAMAEGMSDARLLHEEGNIWKRNNKRPKTELTKKQKKKRILSKIAKKSRKINYKNNK